MWDLVQREMGSTDGAVSLGCTLGCGAGNWFWNQSFGSGARGTGLLETLGNLGVKWGGMGCCGLGCFSILFFTLGEQRCRTEEGNGMGAVGVGVSLEDDQLENSSQRAVLDCS